jgi:methylase of polypeptide subunit release factors
MYDGFLKCMTTLKNLKPQGILVFEIGAGQENLVTRILEKSGSYDKIEYFDDGEQIRAISAVCK